MAMDEFDMMYDDWMTFETVQIERTYVAKEMAMLAEIKYPYVSDKIDERFDHIYDKALATHQKLAMMLFAKSKLAEAKADFESTQNMTIPALYGMSKTMILFYFESMIVFARNALDVAAYAYSDLLFGEDNTTDSFNKLLKRVKASDDRLFDGLKEAFDAEAFVLGLLCGVTKGRALRDTIIHQANVKMGYHEYKENSEKEHLFLELKNTEPLDLDVFTEDFTRALLHIFEEVNDCCKQKLTVKES